MNRRAFLIGAALALLSACGDQENSMAKKAKEYGKRLAEALVNMPRPLSKQSKPKKVLSGRG